MPAPQADPWQDVSQEYHSGGGIAPQPISPSGGEDEDWKLFTPGGGDHKKKTTPGFVQALSESLPLQMREWPQPGTHIPGVGETFGMAIPNMILGGGELINRLLTPGERAAGLGNLAGSMATGVPLSAPPLLREGPVINNGAGAAGIARDFLARKALSTILPPGASGPALSILKQMFGGPAEEPFDIFSREAPKMGAPQPALGPAPRSAPGWQGMAPPTIPNPPEFSGVPTGLPSGRTVGGAQNIGPVPSGPASVLPTDLLDKFAQGAGKYKRFADIPADAPVRERIIREVQKITGEEMSNRLNQVIKLTPESATPPITPPPTENPMAAGPPANPFQEHPEAMIHARLGVAMKDAKDMEIAQRLRSLGLDPEQMSVEELTPHYKALGYRAPGKSGGQYARQADVGREHLIRMFKSLEPPTP